LRGVARFTEPDALGRLAGAVRARGQGHIDVVCEIVGEQRPATLLTARFFARLRP
jgi:hypothetical protein